jgi:hypothetical protein
MLVESLQPAAVAAACSPHAASVLLGLECVVDVEHWACVGYALALPAGSCSMFVGLSIVWKNLVQSPFAWRTTAPIQRPVWCKPSKTLRSPGEQPTCNFTSQNCMCGFLSYT